MGTETQNVGMSLFPTFPDERTMERSADGTEPIRGGSVGFNRILGTFVERARKDTTPFASLFLINGMTLFRNNYKEDWSDEQIKVAWEKDIELFSIYLGAYRVALAGGNDPKDQTVVLVYLPTYDKIPKPLRMDHGSTKLETQLDRYQAFYTAYKRESGVLIDDSGVKVICAAVGEHDLPHRELYRLLHSQPEYKVGLGKRKVVMISHIPMDYFLAVRIPTLMVWESYTAKFKGPKDFGKRLDPSGDIPFDSLMYGLFGDRILVRCVLDVKAKRFIRNAAKEYKFNMRSPTFIANKLTQLSNVPVAELSRFNFV